MNDLTRSALTARTAANPSTWKRIPGLRQDRRWEKACAQQQGGCKKQDGTNGRDHGRTSILYAQDGLNFSEEALRSVIPRCDWDHRRPARANLTKEIQSIQCQPRRRDCPHHQQYGDAGTDRDPEAEAHHLPQSPDLLSS